MPSVPIAAFLQVRGATGGVFSPDGRKLAFLLDETGTPQVYRLDGPGAFPHQLTFFDDPVRSVHWSPDGSCLLFSLDEGGSEREQLFVMRPDGSELRRLTTDPAAVHRFGAWSPDGEQIACVSNSRDPAAFDVYLLDRQTGESRPLLQRGRYYTVADWSPDGASLLIREHHSSHNEDLLLLQVDSGELRLITPHVGDARYTSARFLPDSRNLLVCTDQDRDFSCLARLDVRTLKLQRILERRAELEGCDVSADGRQVVALLNRDGWSELVLGRMRDRTLTGVTSVPLPGIAASVRMARRGEPIAVTLNGPSQPFNVWAMDPSTTSRVLWTRVLKGPLDHIPLVEPVAVRYQSHDGLEIPAWLYRPPGTAGRALPTVVHIHGGPEGQARPNFSPIFQYLVHCGYAVLAPNVRGSSGYGRTYLHQDDREKRYDALRDVEYAHRWLAQTGLGDPRRVAIMGSSYGGFTVLWCLAHQPELWSAGVDLVGIANFETFFRHTAPWRRKLRVSEYGDPEWDRELLRDLSPIHAVDGIRVPLMVVQGANDPRVPREESDQLVEQLRERRRPVEYLLFPDEGHGIIKLPNPVRAYNAVAELLERALGDPVAG